MRVYTYIFKIVQANHWLSGTPEAFLFLVFIMSIRLINNMYFYATIFLFKVREMTLEIKGLLNTDSKHSCEQRDSNKRHSHEGLKCFYAVVRQRYQIRTIYHSHNDLQFRELVAIFKVISVFRVSKSKTV